VLTAPSRDYPWVNVAVGERGEALVAWHWQSDSDVVVGGRVGPLWAAVGRPDGRWARPRALGDGGEAADVALAVSSAGRMLAAWIPTYFGTRSDREPSRLIIAERAAGSDFAPARELATSTPGEIEDGGPVASVADDGRALVAWVRPTGPTSFGTGPSVVETFTRPPVGDFASQTLTTEGSAPEFLTLAAARDGRLALGWTQAQPGRAGRRVVFSIGAVGAALPAAEPVSNPRDDPTWPTAAITADGDVIVAWLKGGFGSGPVLAAVHRTGAPYAQGTRIRRRPSRPPSLGAARGHVERRPKSGGVVPGESSCLLGSQSSSSRASQRRETSRGPAIVRAGSNA
jgi:hypothetical protein